MSEKTSQYQSPVFAVLNDHEFELREPFVFEWLENDDLHQITIPAGYSFDGASVPRICWSLTGLIPTGIHMGASAVHDYCYQRRGLISGNTLKKWDVQMGWKPEPVKWERSQCDDMFRQIMVAAGETPWKTTVMYWAVRLFGQAAWDR